jgi:hypothetical protein
MFRHNARVRTPFTVANTILRGDYTKPLEDLGRLAAGLVGVVDLVDVIYEPRRMACVNLRGPQHTVVMLRPDYFYMLCKDVPPADVYSRYTREMGAFAELIPPLRELACVTTAYCGTLGHYLDMDRLIRDVRGGGIDPLLGHDEMRVTHNVHPMLHLRYGDQKVAVMKSGAITVMHPDNGLCSWYIDDFIAMLRPYRMELPPPRPQRDPLRQVRPAIQRVRRPRRVSFSEGDLTRLGLGVGHMSLGLHEGGGSETSASSAEDEWSE